MRWKSSSFSILLSITIILSCSDKENSITQPLLLSNQIIKAADLSSLPMIESKNLKFYNFQNQEEDILTTLINNGLNTVRLRIWNNPADDHSSVDEVSLFAERIKAKGLKLWIDLHYSDTWADPGNQTPPVNWQGISFEQLKDSVYNFTKKIILELNPEIIQIGNEINSGFLFPYGNITVNETQFLELLQTGINAVRDNSAETQIVIHYAGVAGSEWFFEKLNNIDYDIIGLSYYPVWHGKDLDSLKTTLSVLGSLYKKKIIIAETAYPFTLEWNDWTNNIVGLNNQLILPEFPATPEGQKNFLQEIKAIVASLKYGYGFCYWGGELVAFNGNTATNGSSWENQAFYDFNNHALPVIKVYNSD